MKATLVFLIFAAFSAHVYARPDDAAASAAAAASADASSTTGAPTSPPTPNPTPAPPAANDSGALPSNTITIAAQSQAFFSGLDALGKQIIGQGGK